MHVVQDVRHVGTAEAALHHGCRCHVLHKAVPEADTGTPDEDNASGRRGLGCGLGFESDDVALEESGVRSGSLHVLQEDEEGDCRK